MNDLQERLRGGLYSGRGSMESGHMPKFQPAMWAGGVCGIVVLGFLLVEGQYSVLCAVGIGTALLLISVIDKAKAALLTLAYLNLMGDIRRIVSVFAGQPTNDPLLLIGPVIAAALAMPLLLHVRLRDGLSKAMLLLLAIMVLEIFNPKQGGLAVGVSGAVFYIAPMFWFWIGRRYGSPEVLSRLVYNYILPLAVAAAVLGLAQTFVGFLPYEQAWIDIASKTYTSLYVGGSIRAFGFSISSAEYATLLSFGIASAVAAWFGSRRNWMLAFPLLAVAIVLASSRAVVLKLALTFAVVFALRKGATLKLGTLIRLGLFGVVALTAVGLTASHFAPSESTTTGKSSAVQDSLAHEAGGLAHPLDERYSTAGVHSNMLLTAVTQGFTAPIGYGLGATTRAAAKFGSDASLGSSEVDFSDMFVCLGLVGGLNYLAVMFLTGGRVMAYLRSVPRAVSLPVIALLTCSLGSWLIGGQYSTSSILFFVIGGLVYKQVPDQRLLRIPQQSPASDRLLVVRPS